MSDAIDKFHEHLDKCSRCRNRPFDLCPTGQKLIEAVGKNVRTHDPDDIRPLTTAKGADNVTG